MKIFSVTVIQIDSKPSKILASEYELSSFGYFQRGSIQEFMNFFSKTLAERTPNPGDRQSVENQGRHFSLITNY
jgi:synaptobrevin family protein YKT6